MSVDVLHDDDGIIYEHAQNQHEAEEHDHVECVAEYLDEEEGDEHAERYDHCHDGARSPAQEQQEHDGDQDERGQDVVFQVGHHVADVPGHVECDVELYGTGDLLLCPGDNGLDVIGDVDHVGTDTLLDTEGDVLGSVETRVAGSVFESGLHVGDV